MTAHFESERLAHTCFDTASLKMVLGCSLAGLANHALYMHRLAPSEVHALGLIGRFCQNAYRSLSMLQMRGQQLCLTHLHGIQMCTPEHALWWIFLKVADLQILNGVRHELDIFPILLM